MNGRNIGMAIGIFIGIIISLFVIKAFNKDGKMKTKYDEMQELVRGRHDGSKNGQPAEHGMETLLL